MGGKPPPPGPQNRFLSFMNHRQGVGAEPIITAHTAGQPRPWPPRGVQRAVQKRLEGAVKYWEAATRSPATGTYGANWEADSHNVPHPSGGLVTIGIEPSQTSNCGPGTYRQKWWPIHYPRCTTRTRRQGLRVSPHARVSGTTGVNINSTEKSPSA